MQIIFVSLCEKQAIQKTRSVLDAYANRTGDATWSTATNEEGLQTIKAALKNKATRQTAVACYRNKGVRQMRLLWTVGRTKAFRRNSTVAHRNSADEPLWLKDARVTAKLSGLGHDIGKAGFDFQEKLLNAVNPSQLAQKADPVRHEIISVIVLDKILSGASWDDAWANLRVQKKHPAFQFIEQGISRFEQAVLFCIATHHKLFDGPRLSLDLSNHLSEEALAKSDNQVLSHPRNHENIRRIAINLVHKLQHYRSPLVIDDPVLYWYGISLVARAGLILADHKVSAEPLNHEDAQQCFANTRVSQGKSTRPCILNQSLDWHLSHVGREAELMVRNMVLFNPPSLSQQSIDTLTRLSSGRFVWQNQAVDAIKAHQPSLIFNVAATGSGKTRMNAKAIATLAKAKGSPLRLTVVFNLRSLTLQTGTVYREELALQPDEMAVVIGDGAVRKLYDYERDDIDDNALKEAEESEEYLISGHGTEFEVPEWLEKNCKTPSVKAVALTPVLISTIDYVINAGDPRRQAKHAIALFRLMHSDLIIDEIDSYDPKALCAVIRIIKYAGLFGRSVVVSSATLTAKTADAVYRAYAAGYAIYQQMNRCEKSFSAMLIDDLLDPLAIQHTMNNEDAGIIDLYQQHMMAVVSRLNELPVTKKAEIIRFDKNLDSLHAAALKTTNSLHERHRWGEQQTLSIGLIRMANIEPAIALARFLSSQENTYVCCYHSQHFTLQRFHIERRLDFLLNRKDPCAAQKILADPEIQDLFRVSTKKDIKIIIIATPVEEVGRDHDFDWAIIEPSSAQSIVQTAGRVNRHRLQAVNYPNIALLQFNIKSIKGKKPAFADPGYEHIGKRGITTHKSHDLTELIDEQKVLAHLDNGLRFDAQSHPLSAYDDSAISVVLNNLALPFIENNSAWMGAELYRLASLRDDEGDKTKWYYDPFAEKWYQWGVQSSGKSSDKEMNGCIHLAGLKGLFTLSIEALMELANQVGLSYQEAFGISLYDNKSGYDLSGLGAQRK